MKQNIRVVRQEKDFTLPGIKVFQLRADFPTMAPNQQMEFDCQMQENGVWHLVWWYWQDGIREYFSIKTRLDKGCFPKADGSGMTLHGHPLKINIYGAVKVLHD